LTFTVKLSAVKTEISYLNQKYAKIAMTRFFKLF